nr:Clp protease N-terminal domain-containing protein [Rhodococcus wratislaviensis]
MPAHRRAPPRPRGTSHSPAKTTKVLESSLRQTALLGHEEIGTDHLLLALLDDPASTGARILTDLASLPISEMREHLRRELAHRPTPGPAHRIPIRLNADEYTRAHAAAQNLETSGPRPHHRRPRTTRITSWG